MRECYVEVSCSWCGRVEAISPREEANTHGPFYCSDECNLDACEANR